MGRKGIGKLSLFSIADRIAVHTKKADSQPEAFEMDADKIRRAVEAQEQSEDGSEHRRSPRYRPQPVEFDEAGFTTESGTSVRITNLRKERLTQNSIAGLRKRIARRFGLLAEGFEIAVNEQVVGFEDRDYFHKARFIFQYGEHDYASHCRQLDTDEDTGAPLAFVRTSRFNSEGDADPEGEYEIGGWIAMARRSNDLDDRSIGNDDNLNKITILMRGKVAQEDLLQEYRLGGMFTKYIFGELHADFLDEGDEDVATTSRQRLAEDHPMYQALKNFIEAELRHIWSETNTLKDRRALETALESNPHVRQWFDNLRPASLKQRAKSVFRGIDLANMDDDHRHEFYANAVLAFERLKLDHALEQIDQVSDANIESFLSWLADMDAIEASRYHEIVRERLAVIEELQRKVDDNKYERVLEQYIFDHLWLLDPAWERATEYQHMENQIQNAVERVPIRGKEQVRIDIRYRRIAGAHVIVELKRPSVKLSKTDIEAQVLDYIAAVEAEIAKDRNERRYPIESICLLGELPQGWQNDVAKRREEESLRVLGIRVMTYSELVNSAQSAYSKFVKTQAPVNQLRKIVEAIRSYKSPVVEQTT